MFNISSNNNFSNVNTGPEPNNRRFCRPLNVHTSSLDITPARLVSLNTPSNSLSSPSNPRLFSVRSRLSSTSSLSCNGSHLRIDSDASSFDLESVTSSVHDFSLDSPQSSRNSTTPFSQDSNRSSSLSILSPNSDMLSPESPNSAPDQLPKFVKSKLFLKVTDENNEDSEAESQIIRKPVGFKIKPLSLETEQTIPLSLPSHIKPKFSHSLTLMEAEELDITIEVNAEDKEELESEFKESPNNFHDPELLRNLTKEYLYLEETDLKNLNSHTAIQSMFGQFNQIENLEVKPTGESSGTNNSYFVKGFNKNGDVALNFIFKPKAEERGSAFSFSSVNDNADNHVALKRGIKPGSAADREVLGFLGYHIYHLNQFYGNLIPTTTIVNMPNFSSPIEGLDGLYKEANCSPQGSIQKLIPHVIAFKELSPSEKERTLKLMNPTQARGIALTDMLLGNTDRYTGNLMLDMNASQLLKKSNDLLFKAKKIEEDIEDGSYEGEENEKELEASHLRQQSILCKKKSKEMSEIESKHGCKPQFHLIDHGCVATDDWLDAPCICWLDWPCLKENFTSQELNLISSLNWENSKQQFKSYLPLLSEGCLRTLETCFNVVQTAAIQFQFSPYEIGCLYHAIPKLMDALSIESAKDSIIQLIHYFALKDSKGENFSDIVSKYVLETLNQIKLIKGMLENTNNNKKDIPSEFKILQTVLNALKMENQANEMCHVNHNSDKNDEDILKISNIDLGNDESLRKLTSSTNPIFDIAHIHQLIHAEINKA